MSTPGILPPLGSARAAAIVRQFAGRRLVVVGDVMLDHFVVGRVRRISPEAPVPVVEFDHDEHRSGGAANVAQNVRALGADVTLVGVVGRDGAADRLRADLQARGLGTHGLIAAADRGTTTKLRIVTTRNQQVARVDYEQTGDVSADTETALIAAAEAALDGAAAVVVSDYLKGAVTAALMMRLVDDCRRRHLPLLVDPKIPHLDRYAGATLITPNHVEAEAATAQPIRTADDARAAARAFRARAACHGVLVTRGEHGMWLLDGDTEGGLEATAREVADVTGAGDTVIATCALALAAGARSDEAARLANEAAGLVVGRFGPATASADELLARF